MKRVLVTGGTGYIGSHTAVELIKAGYEVLILDNLFNSKITVLDKIEKITGKKPGFFKVDLKNYEETEKVFKENKIDSVIHFAGLKAVGESVEKPLDYYENNIGGTVNLLKAMLKHKVFELVFSSSATVYGEQETPAYNEAMQTGVDISSPYGWTKAMIEQIIKDTVKANPTLKATILRYFNPIGADSSGFLGEDPNGRPNNLMPIVMKVYRKEIPELVIYGDDYPTEDGSCVRDYIHVSDLSRGHLAALENISEGVSIYNLGSGKGTSVFEIIENFERISGEKLPKRVGERRAGDLPGFFFFLILAEKELAWKTDLTVEDAIRDTLNYLKNLS